MTNKELKIIKEFEKLGYELDYNYEHYIAFKKTIADFVVTIEILGSLKGIIFKGMRRGLKSDLTTYCSVGFKEIKLINELIELWEKERKEEEQNK